MALDIFFLYETMTVSKTDLPERKELIHERIKCNVVPLMPFLNDLHSCGYNLQRCPREFLA